MSLNITDHELVKARRHRCSICGRTVALCPEWGTSDHYIAEIIPSRAGDYSFRVFGTIGEQAIDEVFTSTAGEFSSVEPVSDVSFPDAIPSTVELLEQIEALEAGE